MIDLAAIEQAPLVRFVAVTAGVYPALSAMHVIGVALLFGPIALADLRLVGVIGARLDAAMPILRRAAIFGFALAVVTGLVLASVQIATRYAGNVAFLAKLGLIGLAGVNLAVHEWRRRRDPARASDPVAGVASLTLWLAVIFAGRWIAFVD